MHCQPLSSDSCPFMLYLQLAAAALLLINITYACLCSRVLASEPYVVPRAAPGACCPFAHSIRFDAAFESGNLLRAVSMCCWAAEYKDGRCPPHDYGH